MTGRQVKRPQASDQQPLISSFFKSAPQKRPSALPLKASLKKTPERVSISRSDSILSKAVSQSSTFDEFASSEPDYSFGSPEINNFKNPALNKTLLGASNVPNSQKNPIKIEDDDLLKLLQDSGKEDPGPPSSPLHLKRAVGSMDFLASLGGQPRKVLKRLTSSLESASNNSSNPGSGIVELSPEQARIIDHVMTGDNIFFTGSAGTGKSVVLRQLVKALHSKYGYSKVGVTASTGMAACNIEGQTVHKFLGIGLGVSSPQELAIRIKKNRSLVYKWKNLKALVIDEISMIDGKLFTKLSELAAILRPGSSKPFGGIQLICTGDFFQLPPVSKSNDAQYCFQSPMWLKTINRTVVLTQVFRQKGDNELIDMLNSLRYGKISDEMAQKFKSLSRRVTYQDGIEPTELYPTRAEVKSANLTRLRNLPGRPKHFKAVDNVSDPMCKRLYDNMMCEEVLELKEGSQVMYLKNNEEGTIVNGSVGTVVCFITPRIWGEIVAQYRYFLTNPTSDFIEELRIISHCIGQNDWNAEDLAKVDKVVNFDRKAVFNQLVSTARNELTGDAIPIVNFKTTDGTYALHLVTPEDFYNDLGGLRLQSGITVDRLERRQLPLILAWAMSIHKAQGQSIERLRINLQKTFEKGQVYVALSRATSKESLEIYNFDPRKITTSETVVEFYKKLETK